MSQFDGVMFDVLHLFHRFINSLCILVLVLMLLKTGMASLTISDLTPLIPLHQSLPSLVLHGHGVLHDADPSMDLIYDFLIYVTGCCTLESVFMSEIKHYKSWIGYYYIIRKYTLHCYISHKHFQHIQTSSHLTDQ